MMKPKQSSLDAPTDGFYVLEDDHHDQMSLNKFRDQDQFFEYMEEQFPGEFLRDEWEGSWEDPDLNTWSHWTGMYVHDYTGS